MLSFSNIRCTLNIEDTSFFAMALKVGKNASEFTEKRQVKGSQLKFDDFLTVAIDQKAITQQVQRKQKCEIMLYRFISNQTRQSKHLVGIGSITVTNDFFKSSNRRIKITNMLDNEAFVQCRIKIKLSQSQQIFQLNESKISQIESKSHNESLNSFQEIKIQTEKEQKANSFSQTKQKHKKISKNQIPSRLSETCNVRSKNSLQQKIYSDPYLQKIQLNSQEKLLGNGSEKTQNMRQDFRKTHSRIITENDQILTQKSCLPISQNQSLMQLCMNLQNQNNALMTKIMQLQVYQKSKIQETGNKKDTEHKNLCINQPISVTYRPAIKNIRFQQNQTNRSICHSQAKSQKSYSRFNSKGKYLAIGVMKNKDSLNQYKMQKKEISTQTSTENFLHQNGLFKQDLLNLKNSNQYTLNINGINFQDCNKQKEFSYTKKTYDNENRNSTYTTYEPINKMIEEKYKNTQKFLKKYNEKLTQQIKKLKEQNKKLLQQTSGKKFVTIEKYQQLDKKCIEKQNQLKSLVDKIKEKDGRIQQLEVKIIEVESEKMKLTQQFRQQRKSIAYFLKASHFIDEKLKEQSVGPLNRQIEMHIKDLSNKNSGKKGLKTNNSGEFIQTKMNSPFNKFSQMNSFQEANKFSYPTSQNEKYQNYFTARANMYNNNKFSNSDTMSEEEKSRVPRKFSQSNNPYFEQASMKFHQNNKLIEIGSNIEKNQHKRHRNNLYENPTMYKSGFMGTGQTIIQTFGMKSNRH